MAESYIPMLPKINPETNKLTLDKSKTWIDNTKATLENLVASLETDVNLEDVENIDSIPDVWAKPLLFKMALFDIESTKEFVAGLHDRVLGEWRAILAMLALKNVKQLNLKVLHVNLQEDNTEMAEVFKALAPKESANGDENAWLTDIYVIFYNDLPLALTSPTTLVASAADYSSTFKDKLELPWSKDRKTLTDPIKHLSKTELIALNTWLKKLSDDLNVLVEKLDKPKQRIGSALLECLENYQKDVIREVGEVNVYLEPVDSNLNLHMGLARLLNETIEGKEASPEDSAVRLIVNPERCNKQLLLVSPEMAKAFARQEGVNPAKLVVWQGISANDITEKSLQGDRNKIGQITLKGAEFRRPEDFFYDQMAVVEPGNAFPGSLEISGAIALANDNLTPILPVKRELLELFSPQEIISRLSFSDDTDNISLHFNFPLSGTNDGGADFRFTKKYAKRDLNYIQQDVPVIEIWPNIRRKNWDKYYLYYENYQAQATSQGGADTPVNEMYYVEPFTFGQTLEKDFPVQGLKNCFTAKLNYFPEALICNYKTANNLTAATEVGIILLNLPENVNREVGLTWKIGVDFGTSSTMIYYSENKKQPAPLDFSPRLFKVTESKARTQTFINFIASNPQARPDGSFLSIFHLINVNDIQQEIRPLQDGNVLSFVNSTTFKRLGHRVDTNLKWKNDATGRKKVAAYVRQICLQALVEAMARGVDEIQWNFSYPTAFSQEQKLAFEATCREGIKDAYSNSGFKFETDKNVEIWSESKAASYYFNKLNNKGVNFTEGAICIDIGAGTTDISIISGQPARIIYHTSVQYAGRYMFKPIYDNYELFATSKQSKEIYLDNEEQRDALIDTDMRLNSEEYIKNLAFNTGQESVKSVLQGIQFATAGLFYYLGQLLGVLHEAEHYNEDKLPDIFVGGNGSRIFSWLTGGTSIENNPYLTVLEKMLSDASGLESGRKFRLNFSNYPKVEVASGMILEKPRNDNEFFDEEKINRAIFQQDAKDEYICNSVLAGAEFFEGDEKMPPSSFISAHEISKGIRITDVEEFKKFVECFNAAPKLWLDGIPFSDEIAEEVIKNAKSFYAAYTGEEKKKIFVESVFMVELKCLMEMLNYED